MTTSKKRELDKRMSASGGSIAESVLASLKSVGEHTREWYRSHIVEYFDEVLGVTLWPEQANLAKLMQDEERVAGKSGRRTGKSTDCAGIALWWYDCWNGRVIMTSATDRQVNDILWREVTLLRANAKRPIEGKLGVLARTGLRDGTGREIVGFTAREGEAMQGFAASARNPLMFIVDEASGVEQPVFDAIQGNRAGGGKLLLVGNPTRTVGEFFDAFHSKKRDTADPKSIGYATVTLSTVEAAKFAIPGLANPEYVRERAAEWGDDSALYRVHVLGEFAVAEDGCIFTLALLADAVSRWKETKAEGAISIGLDPAGPGTGGDPSAMAVRATKKIVHLQEKRGLSEQEHVAWVMGAVKEYGDGKRVTLKLDRDGPVGWKILNAFREAIETQKLPITLVPVRSSDRAKRRPMDYERVRDELAGNLHAWVKDGGALPDDPRLMAEMHSFAWIMQVTGRLKITSKDDVRAAIGRSPNLYDAVALACWEKTAWIEETVDDGDDDVSGGDEHDVVSPYGDPSSPYE